MRRVMLNKRTNGTGTHHVQPRKLAQIFATARDIVIPDAVAELSPWLTKTDSKGFNSAVTVICCNFYRNMQTALDNFLESKGMVGSSMRKEEVVKELDSILIGHIQTTTRLFAELHEEELGRMAGGETDRFRDQYLNPLFVAVVKSNAPRIKTIIADEGQPQESAASTQPTPETP